MGFYATFSMKSEAAPIAQKPSPVAYYFQQPLKKWWKQYLEEEIFEEVPEGEPVIWCLPLVVQPKPAKNTCINQRRSGTTHDQITASKDLRVPNQYMERQKG